MEEIGLELMFFITLLAVFLLQKLFINLNIKIMKPFTFFRALIIVVIFIATYLAFSFVTLEIDFTKWNEFSRIAYLVLSFFLSLISLLPLIDIKTLEEGNNQEHINQEKQ